MADIKQECPWMVDMWGIPVCRLNVLPCERVPQNLCDQIKKENASKEEGK